MLVGGFAVILYGLPRLTQDIDLFIKPNADNIKGLRQALLSVFADESINEISLDMLYNYPVVRYGSPEGLYLDLNIQLGNAFRYEDIQYSVKIIDGQTSCYCRNLIQYEKGHG